MSQMSKKLVLSVLAVVLTVVALGTTTFAWFTLTNVAQVQSFQAQVVADEGMEISLANPDLSGVATNPFENVWVTALTTTMIQDYIELRYGDFKFSANTSANGETFSTLGGANANKTGVLEIDLRFRSQTLNTISWSGVDLSSNGVGFAPNVSFLNTTGEVPAASTTGTFRAANAARIAVDGTQTHVYELPGRDLDDVAATATTDNTYLGEQTVNLSSSITTIQVDGVSVNAVVVADANTENTAPTYDGNVYLYAGDEYLYNGTDYVLYSSVGFSNPADYDLPDLYAGQLSYYYETTNEFPFGFGAIDTVATVDEIPAGGLVVATMTASGGGYDYTGGVTIRIWIEGWDPDMFNAILSDIITASFTFTGSTV